MSHLSYSLTGIIGSAVFAMGGAIMAVSHVIDSDYFAAGGGVALSLLFAWISLIHVRLLRQSRQRH